MESAPGAPPRLAPRGALLGLAGSLLLHGLVYALLSWVSTLPEVDFELRLPDEIEFGVTEMAALAPSEPEASEPTPEPPKVETDAPAETEASAASPDEREAPEKEKRREPDAAVPDAGPNADAGVGDASPPDASPRDAASESPRDAAPEAAPALAAGPASDPDHAMAAGDAPKPELDAFAPPGAQLALRLHMGRVRASPLAADVEGLLSAIPDWKLLLDGSGIEPLRDLERMLLASPNLKRENFVVAGQYVGDESVPRKAVENLAKARQAQARWKRHDGIAVAPWHDADATERIIALIARERFVISRPEDLQRVLAVATTLAERGAETAKSGKKTQTQAMEAGDALLGLRGAETLAVSVEGARVFVQGQMRGIPDRLEARAIEADQGIEIQAEAHFDDEAQAKDALAYWTRVRSRYASHPLLAFTGMRKPLVDAELRIEGPALRVQTRVSLRQARVLLGFIRGAFDPGAQAAPAPPLAPSPTPSPASKATPKAPKPASK
ncbi:MAG: hypothetical protein OEZ06_17215 [Myxococcales bacterium]|nr:hypothetical protein [Myxococcales bacterium]